MQGASMVQFAIRAATYAAFLLVLAITINAAPAQEQRQDQRQERREQRQHQPGQFDFYVLALSWSPSFCQASAERGREAAEQCGTARPYSFVVHGLWPQYERGFPRACEVPAPRLNRELMSSMLDLMHLQRAQRPGLFRSGAKGPWRRENSGQLRGAEGADHRRSR